jgi:hypothetical protein
MDFGRKKDIDRTISALVTSLFRAAIKFKTDFQI